MIFLIMNIYFVEKKLFEVIILNFSPFSFLFPLIIHKPFIKVNLTSEILNIPLSNPYKAF